MPGPAFHTAGLAVATNSRARRDRHAVAVIGDGAFPSGVVFEAMNNAGGMKKNLLMVFNDNKMSICPRVGGAADYLDRLRTNPVYTGLKTRWCGRLSKMPVLGDPVERFLAQLKEASKRACMAACCLKIWAFATSDRSMDTILPAAKVPADGESFETRSCCTW